ncbi:hypothetical protein O6H91_Y563300 [Diphasiastrum complanatum]|nr:hypothetical protein O6H91_Y563300 [Diphasiastrum complanatum]
MALMGGAQYAHWSASGPQSDTAGDEVRTIFVLGFPPDVKERELQNLLRWWPGYEASQMNFKGDQPMGFVLFSSAAMAMAARNALQNLVFDADTNSVLRAEMAKKNLYVKRDGPFDHSKRMRTGADSGSAGYPPSFLPGVGTGADSGPGGYPPSFLPSATPAWAPQGYISPGAPYDPYAGYSISQVAHVGPAGYAPVQNTKDNPPCNTLFIGNLGEATSESELRGVFSSQPGFRQMKVLRQGKSTVCFIEFVDVNTAMVVHCNLQGAVLLTSDRGGMRIQFSKNPYGRKKGAGESGSDGVAPAVSGLSNSNGVSEQHAPGQVQSSSTT